ncbi:hypothetical protein EPH95_16325 [Salicibibacter halophilus]|uniref:Uncharacterized protein n=1 Tax=Salicibibacter halophilus TaxID=2502791 RepID=A0A514LL19_9BACI|nr:hypothetical protein [Salicibibacter halophilus]QDI92552.1 hypothetical protein EPH95_16325 [Salicibibacter halophilus]
MQYLWISIWLFIVIVTFLLAPKMIISLINLSRRWAHSIDEKRKNKNNAWYSKILVITMTLIVVAYIAVSIHFLIFGDILFLFLVIFYLGMALSLFILSDLYALSKGKTLEKIRYRDFKTNKFNWQSFGIHVFCSLRPFTFS